ncbi:hypothetical protein KOI35_15300 [Actinoplanes bogorensis]|uniref:Pyrroloquinoline-quinone binding quinoprotein n=1 Tax=Paractinoplanes bogorensis TaxID=1610840 RepID=A0ABS5YNB6_9ACTN|nr:hypothetical protein [Actinoplanes bogorensis]MBU2664868.1 hypothetical protein [Actinoplanes bogorensis]
MRETFRTESEVDPGHAVDLALREAGGGRVAGVRASVEFGRPAWLVQFVRGSWLCTAAVDAGTGEVTMILDDGLHTDVAEPPLAAPAVTAVATVRPDFTTVWDLRAATDGTGTAYLATDSGIATVRLTTGHPNNNGQDTDIRRTTGDGQDTDIERTTGNGQRAGNEQRRGNRQHAGNEQDTDIGRTTGNQQCAGNGRRAGNEQIAKEARLVIEDHHRIGTTREVVPVPGGVVGATADGRVLRLDPDGRTEWELQLPATPYTLAGDYDGARILAATTIGALEIDARTGSLTRILGGAARAAAYLPDGGCVLAGHRGKLLVLDGRGQQRWTWTQGEYPERVWARDGRIYLTGEGGLKEILVGEGVIARWASPLGESVDEAVISDGTVFTCSGGDRVEAHGYATAGYAGPLTGLHEHPEVLTLLPDEDGEPWLLVAHRDGLISAIRN